MINILIADDHTIVRKGLVELIEESGKIKVVAEAKNGAEVLAHLVDKKFDCVVLDINMPGRNGLDILKEIKKAYPQLPVLILSMYPEEQYAVRVIRSGASGYLTKDSAPEELIIAILTVALGKKYISVNLAQQLANHFDQSVEKPIHELLSDREYEIMLMIASGKTLTEIANELILSVKTVSTYKTRLLQKLQLKNTTELTNYVFSNKLKF